MRLNNNLASFFMALSDKTFITVAEVKTHLDISESTWDTELESLIEQATRLAMNYCGGRRFIAPTADETEYYDGNSSHKLFPKNYPLKSVTSISYRSGDFNNPTWNALNPATDYILDQPRGIIHLYGICPQGLQNIQLVYRGGYDGASNVPADLKQAVIYAVSREFNRRKSAGINNESIGGGSITWNIDLDKTFTQILDNYRTFLP